MLKAFVMILAFGRLTVVYGQTAEEAGNRIKKSFPEMRQVENKGDYKIHMGLTAGVNSPNGNTGASPEVGVSIGFMPYIPFGLGAEVTTSEIDDGTNDQRTSLLARGSYNMGGDIPLLKHSFIGATGGPMFISGNTEWSMGPLVGFDFPFVARSSDYLSLGLDAKYLYTTGTPDSFITALAVKYWY